MRTISSTEAKARLNAVLAELEATGEPVTITNHGRPVAVLSVLEPPRRKFGRLAGAVTIGEDFDAPMTEEELAEWEKPL